MSCMKESFVIDKKKNQEISFLSVVYKGCIRVFRLVLSTVSYILKHHVSRAIMRHDRFPVIISNRLCTPHSYLDLSTGGLINYFYNRFL